MKKNIIKTAFAGLALAAVVTGCYNPVNLSDTKDEVNKYNDTVVKSNDTDYKNTKNQYTATVVSVTSDLVAKKKLNNQIVLTVKTSNALDKTTFNAIKLYGLEEDATAPTYLPNKFTSEIAYTIADVTVSGTTDVTTKITLDNIDLSSYVTDKLAIVCDAKVLKDVKGNFVLNGNANETCGEEYDSLQNVLNVTVTNVPAAEVKNVSGVLKALYSTVDFTLTLTETKKDNNGNVTGYKFKVSPILLGAVYENKVIKEFVYSTTDAEKLSKIFKIQTIAPGANKWVDENPLSFTYVAEPATDRGYYAEIGTKAAGTKYRVVKTIDPSYEWTSTTGIKGKMTWLSKAYSEVGESGTSKFYTTSETTILKASGKFAANDDVTGVENVQKNLFNTVAQPTSVSIIGTKGMGASYTVEFKEASLGEIDNALKTTAGFKITTKQELGCKEVKSEVQVLKSNENGAVKLIVHTIDDGNKYETDDLRLWVGAGTTVAKNKDNPTQVNFGVPADIAYGSASGYVLLK